MFTNQPSFCGYSLPQLMILLKAGHQRNLGTTNMGKKKQDFKTLNTIQCGLNESYNLF